MGKQRADQISGGVFFVGLAVLFATGWPFFPGILFVLGAATAAQAASEGRQWYTAQGAIWLVGLGLMFTVGFQFWMILLLAGFSMIFGWWSDSADDDEDHEDDEEDDTDYGKRKHQDTRYRLGDDGELVPEEYDEYYDEDKPKRSQNSRG